MVKEKQITIRIQTLEALLRRIPSDHPKRVLIENEYSKRMAGYKGEKSLDYYLSFLGEDYYIFHDIRLKGETYYFQIDVLIITPRFILIIESKNISGTLTFDQKHNQLIREVNGKVDGFQDPISQVKHQEYQLKNWLNSKKLPDFAIETCVVITNANTIIKVTGEEKRNTPSIIKSSNIVFEIERLNEIHNHRKKQNRRQLSQLSNIILNLHTQPVLNILNEFNINVNDILSGVFCEGCNTLSMIRAGGKWKCTICAKTSKTAHLQTINDYYLLICTLMTNKQFRNFANLSSSTTSYKLLSSLTFETSGTTCDRKYHITLYQPK